MKRLETREHLIFYCDVCGEECGCSWTTFASGTEREAHACDRLDKEGNPSCAQELAARMRSLNVEVS